MAVLPIVITQAGRDALTNADNLGLFPIVISEIALGTALWAPDESATALQNEIKRITTIGGLAVADDTIHVTINDSSADSYALGEFGLYTDGGVLFAIYSQAAAITTKASDSMLLLAGDIQFVGVPAGAVTVSGSGFTNPPATTTQIGVVQLASDAEAQAKNSNSVLTASNLAALLASETFAGLIRLASNAEAQAKSAQNRSLTPANLAALAATTTMAGLLEIATNAEGNAGTDSVRAITAAVLKYVLDNRNASTIVTGLVELATYAETQAGIDNSRAVTPAALASVVASTTLRGLVELATNAETAAGLSAALAITPAGLASVLSNYSQTGHTHAAATTVARGLVELASNAETNTGTDSVRAVTPAGLKYTLDNRNATTTTAGLIRTASNAEAQAKSAQNRSLTPANLSALAATTTMAGLLEIATNAEGNAGTDNVRAITAAVLKYVLDNRNASTTQRGMAELATAAEAIAGTDSARAVTSAAMQAALEVWAPACGISIWPLSTPPTGFLECNGATISRTIYARLFSIIGTAFGAGDGSTTFRIPDLRGEFIRGWDNGRGVDIGRVIGDVQNGQIESHEHKYPVAYNAPTQHKNFYSNPGLNPVSVSDGSSSDNGYADYISNETNTGGTETRPRNIALMFIIKY